jgi:predicted glycosyltransferase involved in capsule biosynthesis
MSKKKIQKQKPEVSQIGEVVITKHTTEQIMQEHILEAPKDSFTIIIPIRVDFIERKQNLEYQLFYLNHVLSQHNYEIIVIERDKNQSLNPVKLLELNPNVRHIFRLENTDYFNKNIAINNAVQHAKNEILMILDVDILIPVAQINMAMLAIGYHDLVHPFHTPFYLIPLEYRNEILMHYTDLSWFNMYEMDQASAPEGGCILMKKKTLIEVGGFNERFHGYAPEDVEFNLRVKRYLRLRDHIPATQDATEYRYIRAHGPLYHLNHPKNGYQRADNPNREYNAKVYHHMLRLSDEQFMHHCKSDSIENFNPTTL